MKRLLIFKCLLFTCPHLHAFAPSCRDTSLQQRLHRQQQDCEAPPLQFLPRTPATTKTRCSLSLSETAASLFLRGGAQVTKQGVLSLSRESYNIQMLAAYGTVTALIMNASLRLYSSTKFAKDKESGKSPISEYCFTAFVSLSIISGAFTAILFNILAIYSKEALGTGNDAGYLAFQAATAIQRRWGFRSFLCLLSSFVGSFLLSLWSKVEEKDMPGMAIFVASLALTFTGIYHIKGVLNIATKFLYS